MKISNKWKQISFIYKRFSESFCDNFTFTGQDELEMYLYESNGTPIKNMSNGYFHGKRIMDITISMWKQDINEGNLCIEELQNDFPDWFLKKVKII